MVTTGFAISIYPIVVVTILMVFGDISDHIGRRTTMLLGLGASLVGAFLFAATPKLWLFAGRAFMGVGVGLTAGPSTAAMVEFSAEGQAKRAASITAAAQAFGFAAALLLGGALTQYAPWPAHLSFWALFALIALLFTATWFLPRHVGGQASSHWRAKVPSLPSGLGPAFALASIAVTTAYLSLGIVALVLGAIATQRGLGLAVNLGAGVITLLSLATVGMLATLPGSHCTVTAFYRPILRRRGSRP